MSTLLFASLIVLGNFIIGLIAYFIFRWYEPTMKHNFYMFWFICTGYCWLLMLFVFLFISFSAQIEYWFKGNDDLFDMGVGTRAINKQRKAKENLVKQPNPDVDKLYTLKRGKF